MTLSLYLILRKCKLSKNNTISLAGTEEQIGGFDLICRGTPVKLPSNSTYMTHLGCQNNRNQQLKKLAKATASRLVEHYNQEQAIAQSNPDKVSGSSQAFNANNQVPVKK